MYQQCGRAVKLSDMDIAYDKLPLMVPQSDKLKAARRRDVLCLEHFNDWLTSRRSRRDDDSHEEEKRRQFFRGKLVSAATVL